MESRILLGYVLGKDAAELIAHDDHTLSAAQIDAYHKIAGQRQQGVPVAYLTGIREFWSLPIKVNDRVLIPRHETETLVERVLALIDGGPKSDPKSGLGTRILELGTGSGAHRLGVGIGVAPHQASWLRIIQRALSRLRVAIRPPWDPPQDLTTSSFCRAIGSQICAAKNII